MWFCSGLVRDAVFGFAGWPDLLRLGVLVAYGLIMRRVAIHGNGS